MGTRQPCILALMAIVGSVVLSACGGSGGGIAGVGSNTGGGGGGSLSLFAVDDMNTGFDHVWVTINKVDLVGAGSTTTNIFDATAAGGKVVDLRTLHDASGARFLLLGGCNTPVGNYTGVNITLASGLTIMPTGASSGVAATFGNSSGGTFVMSLTFPSGQNISSTNKVVLDFNLANWNLNGTTVTATNNAFLALGSTVGITDPTRHQPSDYEGTLSTLGGAAPIQTFTLTQGKSTFNVTTAATTVVTNSDGSSNPTLAGGERIDVIGWFDATNNVLNATSILIHVGADASNPPMVHGTVQSFDPVANTVTVALKDCDDFQPSSTTITVNVAMNTTYFGPSGVTDTHDQFFADLVAGTSQIYAIGSVNGSSFTASKIQIQETATTPDEIAVHGTVSNTDPNALTFDVGALQMEGHGTLNPATVIHVITTPNTQYLNSGSVVNASTFFTSLSAQGNVSVRGTIDTRTLVLTATLIGNGSSDGFHF